MKKISYVISMTTEYGIIIAAGASVVATVISSSTR